MKFTTLFLAILTFVILFVGCGHYNDNEQQEITNNDNRNDYINKEYLVDFGNNNQLCIRQKDISTRYRAKNIKIMFFECSEPTFKVNHDGIEPSDLIKRSERATFVFITKERWRTYISETIFYGERNNFDYIGDFSSLEELKIAKRNPIAQAIMRRIKSLQYDTI